MGGWLYLIRLPGARLLLGFGTRLLGLQLLPLAGARLLSLGVRLLGQRVGGTVRRGASRSWSKSEGNLEPCGGLEEGGAL